MECRLVLCTGLKPLATDAGNSTNMGRIRKPAAVEDASCPGNCIIERVGNAAIMQPQAVTIDGLIRSTWLAIATVAVSCVAGILYVLMLNGLTRTQVATYDSLLGQQSGNSSVAFGPQF